MSARPGIIASKTVRSNGGQSPNNYRGVVTAELRVYWPPLATDEEITIALNSVIQEAQQRIKGIRA
jgi:hypothetical protein